MRSRVLKVVVFGLAILPLAVTNAPGVDWQQAVVARVAQVQEEPQVSLDADLVEVLVTVVDSKGRPVHGLTRSNFDVLDNGARQQIAHFTGQVGPLSLGVVLDATGMTSDTVDGLLRALRSSRLVTEHAAQVSLIAFNDRASVAMGFVGTGDLVLPDLRFSDRRGRLSLGDAVVRAEAGLQAAPGVRTVILLITEGGTSLGSRRISNGVETGRAELYAVFPTGPYMFRGRSAVERQSGNPDWPWWRAYSFEAADRNVNRAAVASLARHSGGRALYAFSESERSRIDLFDQIGDEATSQYAIGFYPTANEPGWHRLDVRITPKAIGKGLSIVHRTGYRASR